MKTLLVVTLFPERRDRNSHRLSAFFVALVSGGARAAQGCCGRRDRRAVVDYPIAQRLADGSE